MDRSAELPPSPPRGTGSGRGLALIAGVLAGCGAPDAPGPDWTQLVAPGAAPQDSPPRLHVEGASLKDEAGNEVRLRGLNVCSLEFDRDGANWQLEADGGSPLLDALADATRWNANVVRMPVNQEWFLTDDAYVARVETLIDASARRGLYVLLDVQWEHAERTEPYQLNILKQPTFGVGNTTEAFWHLASGRLGNRKNLLFDLVNEPHDTPAADVAASMQKLADRIHQATPSAVLIIAGADWAHSVRYYLDHPLRGDNLVYSAHQYLPYDAPAQFRDNFERTAERAPVLLAELSSEASDVDGRPYQDVLVERAEAAGVDGWLVWAIGCGVSVDDDASGPPHLRSLASQLRSLNP
jgi:hypothetical protein